jgi:hypothetical protein
MVVAGRGPVRLVAALVLAGGLAVASASPAFAPHVAHLILDKTQVKAGEQLTVFGQRGYGSANPVEIRLDSPDGPLLGTFQPNNELYAMWGPGPVTIPADVAPGAHTLYATQVLTPAENHIRGIPARADFEVLGAGGAPVLGAQPVQEDTSSAPADLVREEGVSTGSVLLVALGVAGVAMMLAGAVALASSRRRSEAEVAR